MENKGGPDASPLAEELLAVDECWEKKKGVPLGGVLSSRLPMPQWMVLCTYGQP